MGGKGIMWATIAVGALASLSCAATIPTQASLDIRTAGNGGGLIAITRTGYGSCDGGGTNGSCETMTQCIGGGTGYLCGVGYEADHPVSVAAYPDRFSTFRGWSVTVTPPNDGPRVLPDDPAPTKDLSQSSPATISVVARFEKLDAGSE